MFLFTDLVPFPQARAVAGKEDTLLIYSVQRGTRSLPKLITAFPVRSQMASELEASAHSARKVRLRLRYNAYVRGLFGREVWGQRHLAKADDQN